jgi:hypothetical protein
MSDQSRTCAIRLPSFGRVWAMQVRSWRSLRSCTCRRPEAGGSSPRLTLSRLLANTRTSKRLKGWTLPGSSGGPAELTDTPLATAEEPRPGSHVISPRWAYMHHGIYVGDGKVVHYAGLARRSFRGRIEEVALAEFAYGRNVWTRHSELPAFLPQEVIRRARSRVGENRYRVFRNNCEHFCEWCLRGESRSYQIERFFPFHAALVRILTASPSGGGATRLGA